MKFARVISVDGKWQICTRDKVISLQGFHQRYGIILFLFSFLTGGVQLV